MSGEEVKNKNKFVILLCTILVIGFVLWCVTQLSSSTIFLSPISDTTSPTDSRVEIVIVGDIMLDRNVRNKINEVGFDKFFSGVRDVLIGADITIGNLEGPFTTYPSKTSNLKSKELIFTFDPALAPKLSEIGFDVLGLANNHTYNFGREGFRMTKEYITEAGMVSYGDPDNKDSLSVLMQKKGITIGIVGFHEFHYKNFDLVLSEIRRIRSLVDFLIVTPHWGPEYETSPTQTMQKLAWEWIDNGADLIVGTHSHVISEVEEYNDKKIFYSLGNFVFDQYFSKETSEGRIVKVTIEKQGGVVIPTYFLQHVVIERDGVRLSD